MADSPREFLLEMTDISKSFPGVKALDNVNLRVRPHSIHALMGENGAGKSTLLKCLFGIYKKMPAVLFFRAGKLISKAQKRRWNTAFQWCIRS
ncbi:Galactose/methyl galactoside import ATP-binding protein MglA [Serratia plymuthica]|uniref:Ribose/galactose/methyl galactoside import ATP-binding protein n=1 Tax=Serratia plymuthica TaxID=82996 RepID=A0A2X4U7F6_SERPL|nr:Galactose/methyl galactoside import ATP-binding protein MglA [Serratia plymuthica]